jgi:hypothetical protein
METTMRRTSERRLANDPQYPSDERPRHIPGATITSWHGAPEIDLDVLFGVVANGVTVAGGSAIDSDCPEAGTVSMSDGDSITFASPNQFETVVSL